MTFKSLCTLRQTLFIGSNKRHRNIFRGGNQMVVGKLKTHGVSFMRLSAVLVLMACYFNSIVAGPIGLTPLAVTAGKPMGSYSLSEMEQVSLFNGQFSFALPLLSIGGRGSVNHTITIPIQRRMQISNLEIDGCSAGVCQGEDCDPESCASAFIKQLGPVFSASAFPGPVKLVGHREHTASRDATNTFYNYISSLSRFTLTMADGTELELRDSATGGKPFEWQGFQAPPGFPRGKEFVTADGTSATFYSNDTIADRRPLTLSENPVPPYCGGTGNCSTMLTPSGFVMMADGTRYDISQGRTTRMTDRNGNRIEFQYTTQQRFTGGQITLLTTILDPLDRATTISYGIVTGNTYDEINYKGVDEVARSIKIYRQPLESTLLSGTLPTLGQLYPQLNPHDNFKDNPSVVSRVELANGRSYIFKYNPFGELARVDLPTGGAIEYDFKNGVQGGPENGLYGDLSAIPNSTQETFLYRRLAERRVFVGGNMIGFSTYGKSDIWNQNIFPTRSSPLPFIEVKHFDVQSPTCYATQTCKVLGIQREYFFSSAAQSYAGSNLPTFFKHSRYPVWNHGRMWKTETLDTDGSTVLQTQEFTWNQSHTGWWQSTNSPEPPNNPKVVETKTTLTTPAGTIVAKKSAINPGDQSIGYDQFHNQTDLWEYDWGSGTHGPLLRHIQTSYVTDANYTGSPLANGAHLRRLPREQKVYSVNPENNEDLEVVMASEIIYDEATYVAAPYGSLTGWISPGTTARGNATTTKSWLNFNGTTIQTYPAGSFVIAHATYDQGGNVVTAIDALNRQSTVVYTDADGSNNRGNRAFATLSSSPIPDSSGVQASSAPLVSASLYDHWTGLVVQSTDARGQITTVEYNDPFSRPTRVVSPAGIGEVTFEYEDDPENGESPGTVFSKVRTQLDTDTWEEGFTYYDGLGRKIKSQREDAQGDVFSENVYDYLGRVTRTSSPYRAGAEKFWVETVYDALGRTKEVISPKIAGEAVAAKITTEYSTSPFGPVSIGINQAGNKSRSITNALGQLIRLDESDSANNLGPVDNPVQPTHYKYDVVGRLRRVTQGPHSPDSPQFNPQVQHQSRFFMYDSLGRLIRLRQPEQDTNSTLTLADPLTGNSAWSTAFSHLDSGAIQTVTDAKGVVTTFSYDNLDRVLQRSYTVPQTSDPKKITASTSTVTFKYDGRLSATPDDPSPAVVPLAAGSLTEIANGVSTTQHTSFTNDGKTLSSKQITNGQVYSFTYEYNLAGALKSEVYPSGRVVSNAFDAMGDLSSVSGTMPGQSAVVYASDIRYTPNGSIDQLKLGNNRWENYTTNARQQITEIALGTSATDKSLWKVNYDYGRFNTNGSIDVTKNDGNVIRQTITVQGLTDTFVQTYKYDSLNRLSEAVESSGTNQPWKQTYGYDRYGNRNAFTYDINQSPVALNNINNPTVDPWTNRITTGMGYDYDLNGNIIQDAQSRKYSFDADNRQREIRDAGNQLIATYQYDGEGRRIKKITGAQETVFVYNARGKLIAEYASQPTASAGRSFITVDILNSPRVITNANGDVVSRRDYMPFGENISSFRSGAQKYGVNDGLRKSFTGYERDNESQLDFAEARYYNPAHGRFTTVDPLIASGGSSNPQTFNRYVYAGNNPTLRSDPNGELWYVYYVTKLVGMGSMRVLRYEWHSDNRTLVADVARDYLVYFQEGPVRGLVALDPYENRFTQVSSRAEGLAKMEFYKRQAAMNFLAGAAEASSIILDWSGILSEGFSIEPDSEQYKLGYNTGTIGSSLSIAKGGIAFAVIKKFGKAGKVVTRATAANVLRKAMIEAGQAAGDRAHHIVAFEAKAASQARAVLQKLGIDINSAVNGIFLDASVHARIHTAEYYAEVNRRLGVPNLTKAEAEEILKKIADEIRNGTFPGTRR